MNRRVLDQRVAFNWSGRYAQFVPSVQQLDVKRFSVVPNEGELPFPEDRCTDPHHGASVRYG